MKNHSSFQLPTIHKKYHKLHSRLQKAISAGRLAQFSAEKKRLLLQCLIRYEKQLKRWGVTVAAGATMLLPATSVLAQAVPAGNEFQVNTYAIGTITNASIALDGDGDFVVTWHSSNQDGDLYGIYGQRYNSAGTAQGTEFRVNTYTTSQQINPSVAMDSNGDFVIVWSSKGQDGSTYGIYAQRYNNTGIAKGSEFKVNTYTTSSQNRPSVAMDSDGDFVVVWQSNRDSGTYGIYAQRYDNAGVATGSEFKVNTYKTNDQTYSKAAMDNDGDFVVTWQSYGQDGSSDGIYGQRYNNSGLAQGSEFRVNTYTTTSQRYPQLAIDNDGDFVVTWQSTGDVHAQRFNSTGLAQGGEFLVNTWTTNPQNFPCVAMDSDGDFVIAWQSFGQDSGSINNYGGNSVYAQQFTSSGVALGQCH